MVSSRGWTLLAITACGGTASGCQDSGSHSRARMKDFMQWKKICSISTSRASTGRCPLTIIWSKKGASRISRARPLMRNVSFRPGTR